MAVKQGKNASVLVVEDFDDTRLMIRLSLELRGFDVIEAVNGLEAVEVASREHPDLILMDLSLPKLDGVSATLRIRERSDLQFTPIVAVSAHDPAVYRLAALDAGCNEFLTKPVDFEKLEGVIQKLLARQESSPPPT
jgi:two-component system, cell cycle response regulator DivK